MSQAAVDVYKDQVLGLWHARLIAHDFGRALAQDEEALRAECLELLWGQMTAVEQEQVEAWIATNRPEVRPLDSDGWPHAPDPPGELRVVPVLLSNGEWAWFQGAPDGVRYVLAEPAP